MATNLPPGGFYETLVHVLGVEHADTLLARLMPQDWSDLVRKTDLEVAASRLHNDTVELRGEVHELRGEVRAIDGRLTGEIAGMRGDIAALDARLTGDVAALGSRMEAYYSRYVAACVASVSTAVTAAAGLSFAAARLIS